MENIGGMYVQKCYDGILVYKGFWAADIIRDSVHCGTIFYSSMELYSIVMEHSP